MRKWNPGSPSAPGSTGHAEHLHEIATYALELEKEYLSLLRTPAWKLTAPFREAGRLATSFLQGRRVSRRRLPKRPEALAEFEAGRRAAAGGREEVLRAENVGVWFRHGGRDDFRSHILNLLYRRQSASKPFWALEEIDFSAYAGEILGIIGANGAGKTTTCSVIGRVLRPDRGRIHVHGEVSALLSMGTGFNNELTGRENVLLNGLMLGFSRRTLRQKQDEIAAFAGLEDFMDVPVKRYSTGMRSRLGFSIASLLEPEILVLDEALGGGDAEFVERATQRMQQVLSTARAVVVVTHSMEFIRKTCDRAIWIDKGGIRQEGDPQEVTEAYEATVPPRPKKKVLTPEYQAPDTRITERKVAEIRNLGVRFRLKRKPFWALEGVSFHVRQGEIVGIIGANGAGKTTLCRALSRIYRPDAGSVEVSEKISALLSTGAGFNTALAAPENIMLNGMMLGMSKRRMTELTEPIIAFAELEKQRDRPVKYLSKGMKARLSFSIAVEVKPSLLLIDEALSAGDIAFKQKAMEAVDEMIRRAEAVVVVSHNMDFVKKVCTRALWLDGGRLQFDGDPEEAVARYQARVAERKKARKEGRKSA